MWLYWKYFHNLFVMCERNQENMDHVMICTYYGNITQEQYRELIFQDNMDKKYEFEKIVKNETQNKTR